LIGQTAQIAPADKKLYALRDVTGTVESVPLISASIMSKKIAEGIDALVLDVKCGRGAFMKTPDEARALAESLVRIGQSAGVQTQAVITGMNWPMGFAVGNANEVIECIEVLKGRGRADLVANALDLSKRMLVLAGIARDRADAAAMCRSALDSGRALERLRSIIERQGGNPRVIDDYNLMPQAPEEHTIRAERDGFVSALDAGLIGRASVALGGGRDQVDDEIDPGVGIMLPATVGDPVRKGDALLRVRYRSKERLETALPLILQSIRISESPETAVPLVIDEVS
jgi:pyrimidine-nucleoside phosphorylase